MSHYIIICKICNVIISQCRCMDKNKEIKGSICSKCEKDLCKYPVEEPSKVYSYNKYRDWDNIENSPDDIFDSDYGGY